MVRLYAGLAETGRRYTTGVRHWLFVAAAYALVLGVLLAYWWGVERGIRTMERTTGTGARR
jgi:HAMP domain-containing protein